jgi:hypothetical protein
VRLGPTNPLPYIPSQGAFFARWSLIGELLPELAETRSCTWNLTTVAEESSLQGTTMHIGANTAHIKR